MTVIHASPEEWAKFKETHKELKEAIEKRKMMNDSTVIRKVLKIQESHAETWANDSNWIWLINLQEEIDELRMTMLGEHEGLIEHELCQIASIAINWLRRPELLQTSYSDDAILAQDPA